MIKTLFTSFLMLIFFKSCDQAAKISMPEIDAPPKNQILRGLSFVAPPNSFTNNPMPVVQEVNADWIAVIPYGYTILGESKVYFNTDRQWWGERIEGVKETITLAKASKINVLLKPQIYIPRSWTGNLDYKTGAEWKNGKRLYRLYYNFCQNCRRV